MMAAIMLKEKHLWLHFPHMVQFWDPVSKPAACFGHDYHRQSSLLTAQQRRSGCLAWLSSLMSMHGMVLTLSATPSKGSLKQRITLRASSSRAGGWLPCHTVPGWNPGSKWPG